MPATVISVANQKGGVGKTTTVVTTAHALSKKKNRVLVIDLDPQHSSSVVLCPTKETLYSLPYSVVDVLGDPDVTPLMAATRSRYKNVDLIASNINVHALKNELFGDPRGMVGLKEKLTPEVLDAYDYILVDTPPDLGGPMVNNALVASNYYIVPMQADDMFGLLGIGQLMTSVKTIHSLNPELKLLGVLLTIADFRTSITQDIIDVIHQHFGKEKVFDTVIPQNVAIKRCFLQKESVLALEPKQAGAKAYVKFAKELVEWLDARK